MDKYYLLPGSQQRLNGASLDLFSTNVVDESEYFGTSDQGYFESGKRAISYLLEEYKLEREDEVWIATTSDTSFVSSCVTCSVFNCAKPSRVFTEKTKMIWVIHEFGFPHPNIEEIAKISKENNILLVEDVAHSFVSSLNGKRLGSFGDYALHSFPKSYPVDAGGLLTGKKINHDNPIFNLEVHQSVQAIFRKHHPYMKAFADRRRENYNYIASKLAGYKPIYHFDEQVDPFIFGFYSKDYKEIYSALDMPNGPIQMGRTHVKEHVLLPVNAFLSKDQLEVMVGIVNSVLNNV